ncbi:methylated-DNA--[protein]-cysteine S-methyltransferase [Rhodanobacter sp. BL-MT-08]
MTTPSKTIYYDDMDSPIGVLRLVADEHGLREVRFAEPRHPRSTPGEWIRASQPLAFARVQLQEYFSGERVAFDLPLHPLGTPFQLSVWRELVRIPYGATASYGDIAKRIDNPAAVRAVGAANAQNPLPIVVPCHRVIGSNGSLTGFGGGLPTKEFLLALEQKVGGSDLYAASGSAS